MYAHHAPAPGAQEPLVFGQPPSGTIRAMTVGDPVGARDPYAYGGARLSDDVERPLDGLWRLMVVDDRRATTLKSLQGPQHG